MSVCLNVHTCINSFGSLGCLLVCAPPLNTCVRVSGELRGPDSGMGGGEFSDGCEECIVLRAMTGMDRGEQTGSDMETQEPPPRPPSPPKTQSFPPYDPLHTPHLSASHFPFIYSPSLLILG